MLQHNSKENENVIFFPILHIQTYYTYASEKYIRWKIYSFSKHVLNFKHFAHFSCRYIHIYMYIFSLFIYIFFPLIVFCIKYKRFSLFIYLSHIYTIFSYSMRNNIDFILHTHTHTYLHETIIYMNVYLRKKIAFYYFMHIIYMNCIFLILLFMSCFSNFIIII